MLKDTFASRLIRRNELRVLTAELRGDKDHAVGENTVASESIAPVST